MSRQSITAASKRLKKRKIELFSLGDPKIRANVSQFIPTSSGMLNSAIGGGIPCGRVTEIFGEESNGKSSLVADIMMNAQKLGGMAVIIDSEQAFESERAKAMGIKIDDVVYTESYTIEDGFDVIEAIVEETRGEKGPFVIVWDSIAACTTRDELDDGFDKVSVAAKARLISKGVRRLKGADTKNTAIVIVNQVRTRIGSFFGKPTASTGGFAIKYDAALRLELRGVGRVKEKSGDVTGITCKAVAVKNKIRNPFLFAEFDVMFEGGIDDSNFFLTRLVEVGVVKSSGAWYSIDGFEGKFHRKQFKKVVDKLGKKKVGELYAKCYTRAVC